MQVRRKPQTIVQLVISGVVALIMVGAFLLSGGLSPAQAQGHKGPGNSGQTKPGCGYGDKNHTHTGAPGNPNACSSSSSSTSGSTTRSSTTSSSTMSSSTTRTSTTRTETSTTRTSSTSSSTSSSGPGKKHHKRHHHKKKAKKTKHKHRS